MYFCVYFACCKHITLVCHLISRYFIASLTLISIPLQIDIKCLLTCVK